MIAKQAIVLRAQAFQDNHLLLILVTSQGERMDGLAFGARKSRKRFPGGVLEPGNLIQIELTAPKKEGGLWVIQGAELINGYPRLRHKYDRLLTAFSLLKICSQFAKSGLSDAPEFFNAIDTCLGFLEGSENSEACGLACEMYLFYIQGFLGDFSGFDFYDLNRLADQINHVSKEQRGRLQLVLREQKSKLGIQELKELSGYA